MQQLPYIQVPPHSPVSVTPTFRCARCQEVRQGVPHKRQSQTGSSQGFMLLGDEMGITSSNIYGDVEVCDGCVVIIDHELRERSERLSLRNRAALIVLGIVVLMVIVIAVIAVKTNPYSYSP